MTTEHQPLPYTSTVESYAEAERLTFLAKHEDDVRKAAQVFGIPFNAPWELRMDAKLKESTFRLYLTPEDTHQSKRVYLVANLFLDNKSSMTPAVWRWMFQFIAPATCVPITSATGLYNELRIRHL